MISLPFFVVSTFGTGWLTAPSDRMTFTIPPQSFFSALSSGTETRILRLFHANTVAFTPTSSIPGYIPKRTSPGVHVALFPQKSVPQISIICLRTAWFGLNFWIVGLTVNGDDALPAYPT